MKIPAPEKQSTEFNTKDASDMIREMTAIDYVEAFISGDDRKTIIEVAEKRKSDLRFLGEKPKEGETKGPITQPVDSFKTGVQATKSSISGEDIVAILRAKGHKI
jgi:hypothetical protein